MCSRQGGSPLLPELQSTRNRRVRRNRETGSEPQSSPGVGTVSESPARGCRGRPSSTGSKRLSTSPAVRLGGQPNRTRIVRQTGTAPSQKVSGWPLCGLPGVPDRVRIEPARKRTTRPRRRGVIGPVGCAATGRRPWHAPRLTLGIRKAHPHNDEGNDAAAPPQSPLLSQNCPSRRRLADRLPKVCCGKAALRHPVRARNALRGPQLFQATQSGHFHAVPWRVSAFSHGDIGAIAAELDRRSVA